MIQNDSSKHALKVDDLCTQLYTQKIIELSLCLPTPTPSHLNIFDGRRHMASGLQRGAHYILSDFHDLCTEPSAHGVGLQTFCCIISLIIDKQQHSFIFSKSVEECVDVALNERTL